ncbi:MAG TPA: SpoIIE family protein phosphatase [candidate division Zixibacteria bacterium]|nr:SpoIIE family protein phosphatase [candidate division Zixibacteria bacterium]
MIYKKMIVFSLIDTGRSYQPESDGKLDLQRLVESGRKGGLGFYMIKKIMDSVEYISSAGYNELRMIKQAQPVASESIPFLRHMATLRAKFSVWTFLIVLVIVGGAYYYFDSQTTRQMKSHLDETVASLVNTIGDQAAGYVINRRSDVEFDELIVSAVRSNAGILRQVVLTDTAGTILAHSDDIHNIRKPYAPPPEVHAARVGVPFRFSENGRALSYLMLPIRQGDRSFGTVHAVYSSEQLQQRLVEARRRILVLTFVLLMVGVAGIWVLSNYFVDPIVRITQRVRRFASGDLRSELSLEGAEEFYEISRAFNDLMTRVSQDRENIVAREKMVKEIEVASQIQKTLMPRRLPDLPGLEIDTFYRAAAVVGGDLYDVFEIDPGMYCLAVADVSGKGVPASLVMSMLRTVIQIQAGQSHSSRRTLVLVHEYLRENIPPGMFITIMLAVYDSARRRLNFVSAGHNPLLYYHAASGEIRPLNPAGMPMGVPAAIDTTFEQRLEQYELELQDGDLFFMFTDGITEASSREGQYYGIDRLIRFMKAQLAQPDVKLPGISAALMAELEEFCGLSGPADDITFIIGRAALGRLADPPEGTADGARERPSNPTAAGGPN